MTAANGCVPCFCVVHLRVNYVHGAMVLDSTLPVGETPPSELGFELQHRGGDESFPTSFPGPGLTSENLVPCDVCNSLKTANLPEGR